MRKWSDMERQMAPSSQMFSHGGIRRRDWFSDRLNTKCKSVTPFVPLLTADVPFIEPLIHLFRALHISIVTSTDRAMVIG